MALPIRIQMMDRFAIYINEQKTDQLTAKSRKGAALVQFLILNGGEPVPNQTLLNALWDEEKSMNPENALKTLVSRVRVMLTQIEPRLGGCIVSNRGAYYWECCADMTVDLYEIENIIRELDSPETGDVRRQMLIEELLNLYTGDLLEHSEQAEWALAKATTLHNKYLEAVYSYLELMKERKQYEEIITVCRRALDVDSFDDRLHMELMYALVQINRTGEALSQYKHVVQLNYRYLGIKPSQNLQEFYKQIISAGQTLDFSLESIRNELRESNTRQGAFVCEYTVFKEIFNLQMRNLERLGASMFLAIIMIGPQDGSEMDPMRQDNIMSALEEIMRKNLRKGDTITRFAPNIFALLLPTVNYSTGGLVLERIKASFYRYYPNSSIAFNYRVGPLSASRLNEPEPPSPRL
ncbi:MAG: winged helix-turn-helix domain-containing protein [Clostridia bacterium]|nr:winged helix-turn-helix domain-containing protein [Clostridia bacterium]